MHHAIQRDLARHCNIWQCRLRGQRQQRRSNRDTGRGTVFWRGALGKVKMDLVIVEKFGVFGAFDDVARDGQ